MCLAGRDALEPVDRRRAFALTAIILGIAASLALASPPRHDLVATRTGSPALSTTP